MRRITEITGPQPGPRRSHWERLARRYKAISAEMAQLRADAASWNFLHPAERINVEPMPALPEMPPMPEWSE